MPAECDVRRRCWQGLALLGAAALAVWGVQCRPPEPRMGPSREPSAPRERGTALPSEARADRQSAPAGGAGGEAAAQRRKLKRASQGEQGEPQQKGAALYARHCAACHGERGDGQGIAAAFLYPKPRDFRAGRFRLVSTTNAVPTRQDLLQVLQRGMPGSAMFPWSHLPQADLEALVDEVLNFRRQGVRDLVLSIAAENEEELSEEDIAAEVASATAPSEIQAAPDSPETPEAVARGAELYRTKGCASCHGNQGRGDGQQQMIDSEGLPSRPRDLTRGIYKGLPDFEHVFRRLRLGMPGSAMPASPLLDDQQLADLAHFVLSLSTPEARQAAVLRREKIVAKRLAKLPAGPDDPAWESIAKVPVRVVSLWWYFDRPEADLRLQAAHDGRRLALRLAWRDESADVSAGRHEAFGDAAAVQLFRGNQEPFVGMGASDAPTEVWLWSADASPVRLEDVNPRIVVDVYPLAEAVVPTAEYDRPGTDEKMQHLLGLPARAAKNPLASLDRGAASELEAAGPGTLAFRLPVGRDVSAEGRWSEGEWRATFTRPLVSRSSQGVRLRVGGRCSLGLALWDGGRAERDGQKQVSIWQELVLEP